MGSKKIKRKKLKCKKLQKLKKSKTIKRNQCPDPKPRTETDSEETSRESYYSGSRVNRRKYSRSHVGDKYISKVKNFSHIREDYFSYLQQVVKDNCIYCDSVVTDEMLEDLSLELEQYALLACLQVDIYEKSMTKIISDIKKCTQEKQIHEEVKKLLPGSTRTKTAQVKTEKSPRVETYSRIPTISSIRTDDNLNINGHEWTEESFYDDVNYSQYQDNFFEGQDEQSVNWEGVADEYTSRNYWSDDVQQNQVSFEVPQTEISAQSNGKSETVDPLLLSRSQLQRSVEKTLTQCEIVNRQKKDEKERAYIAHILEGDDSLDDKLNDSLSDNEAESKENLDESNLMERLEKMRELFGMEEEEVSSQVTDNHVAVKEKPKTLGKKSTIWKHEKVIQLHRLSMLSSEMSRERREYNRRLFLELFGEDSEEEHEEEYRSVEKYRASCTERISSWIVKHLMPFYHERRIVGRNVFKTLGHHISDAIIDEIQYPDEWTVKYFVSKYFPPKKKYFCDADVLAFQLE